MTVLILRKYKMADHVICMKIFMKINGLYNVLDEMRSLVYYIYKTLCRFRTDPVDQSCKIYLV